MAKWNVDQINYLNMGLMAVSAVLALRFPFELFLVVYAFLGPLHYLTEISWLHDKNYYTREKRDYWFLVGASLAVTLAYFKWIPHLPEGIGGWITCGAFVSAFFFAFFNQGLSRWMILLAAVAATLVLVQFAFFNAVFTVFLPTLIHVFVFTGLFLLAGALRNKGISGILSLVFFLMLASGLVLFHPFRPDYQVSDYVRNNYGYLNEEGHGTGPFIGINYYLVHAFRIHDFGDLSQPIHQVVSGINDYLYRNPVALSLMAFIAFAYTYHYLNWFSKTSIIRWHEISRRRLSVVLLIWAASIGLYLYDYSWGFGWLFFLSFTHVLLEFPLDQRTFVEVGRELRNRIARKGWDGANP